MPDLTDTIETVAAEPASAAVDGRQAANHNLKDLIAADQFLKSTEAVEGTNEQGGPKSAWRALRPAVAIPRGSV